MSGGLRPKAAVYERLLHGSLSTDISPALFEFIFDKLLRCQGLPHLCSRARRTHSSGQHVVCFAKWIAFHRRQ